MENSKNFVNETDYKALWKFVTEQNEQLKVNNADQLDQIEDLEMELAAAKRHITDLEGQLESNGNALSRLGGEVAGLRYAIRFMGAGDPK